MKNVYAGGGEQTVMQIFEEDPDVWHQITHWFGDSLGFEWVVGFVILGLLWFFRKRIRRFLG